MFGIDDHENLIEAGEVFEFFLPDDVAAARAAAPRGEGSVDGSVCSDGATNQETKSPQRRLTMEEAAANAAKEAHEKKLGNISTVRFTAAWTSQTGSICDLDLHIYCYDDKGRFLEKLDFDRPKSEDGAAVLVADEGGTDTTAETCEVVTIEFPRVNKSVSAYLLYLDGDSRNFQLVTGMKLKADIAPQSRMDSFVQDTAKDLHLYAAKTKCRRDFKGLILCCVYRDRYRDSVCLWSSKSIFEPVFVSSQKQKDEICHDIAVKNVPALEKFKPRTFPSVRTICGALSSQALPKLKVKFLKGTGLPIEAFVEALFLQLKDGYPKLLQFQEAAYTVAMLEEMFYQIDFNGDGDCSWEEFTNFAIQAVLSSSVSTSEAGTSEGSSSLNEYVIEYSEDISARDTILSQYRTVSIFKYEHSLRKIILVQDDSAEILLLNDSFEILSTIKPNKLKTAQGSVIALSQDAQALSGVHVKKYVIYDVLYVEAKDMYCYCSSDHVIGIVKEHVTIGGNVSTYSIYNKIYHNQLHVKLCYSEAQDVLCSISSSNVIYGWSLEGDSPLFNISRHNEIITDFITCEDLGCFATCSMDKRIVLWSASSRRVKGIFLGHKRGVRRIHYYKQLMISCAFETDARVWDMNTKDCSVILRGHRTILTNAVLMCDRARDYEEYRALTVDESGEFRLWNIYVRERTSEPFLAPTIQSFTAHNCEVPICNVRFFALPNHQKYSTSYYSDIIACSTKLLHFLPQKNAKEFIPPSCMLYNDPASTLVTGVGPSICKYDIGTGQFMYSYVMHKKDVTAIALDGDRGRKLYIGIANGDILTINFVTGDVVAEAVGFHFKDVTKMICLRYKGVQLFTCSLDGKIRLMEEISGDLHIKYSSEDPFGEGVGIGDLTVVKSLNTMVAISKEDKYWGIWSSMTFKQIALFQENDTISGFVVIGASGDTWDQNQIDEELTKTHKHSNRNKENLLTIAIVTSRNIRIYTIDVIDLTGSLSLLLTFPFQSEITSAILFKGPPRDSVNFTLSRGTGEHEHMEWVLAAATENGMIYLWDASDIRKESESYFDRKYHVSSPKRLQTTNEKGLFSAKQSPNTRSPRGDDDLSHSIDNDLYSSSVENAFSLTSVSERSKPDHLFDPTNTYILTSSFGDVGSVTSLPPRKQWKAHVDSVSKILCLGDNGCIQSTSHDGYQRCWNVDGDCLGELLLPNVTDKMLAEDRRTVPHTVWKFILEKIPVQPHHEEQARAILAKIDEDEKKALETGKNKRHNLRPKSATNSRPSSAIDRVDIENEGKNDNCDVKDQIQDDIDRAAIFDDLWNPPKEREDAPPNKFPSKQELKIMRQIKLLADSKQIESEDAENEGTQDFDDASGMKMSVSNDELYKDPATSSSVTLPEIVESPAKTTKKSCAGNRSNTLISKSMTSLWAQPEQVFDKHYSVSAAFSNDSLGAGFRAGMYDKESLGVLRKLALHPDKIGAYDHLEDAIFLRNSKLSTSVDVPKESELRRAEVLFGSQKDMYKNADAVLRSKEKPSQVGAVRGIVAMARIEQNLNHVGRMVHVVKHGESQKEIDLPSEADEPEKKPENINAEDTIMELRLLKSASLARSTGRLPKTEIDEAALSRHLSKVQMAMDDGETITVRTKRRRRKKKLVSVGTRQMVEKKLRLAIIDIHSPMESIHGGVIPKKVTLTTRQLLPYYKIEEVRYYMDVFSAVDSDFSGDLDINEWVKLFTSMDQSISPHQARMIFMQLDKTGDGVLTSKDLIPIIFNKASREQLQLILMYVQSEIIQKRNDEHCLKPAEVAQLFESYDYDAVGFVPVSFIRDKIRSFMLPESAHFGFMEAISKLEEDEMLNEQEFTRVLKPYSVRQ